VDCSAKPDDQYELTGSLRPLAIPSTLHASLLARLDRLASVKDVAQIGATHISTIGLTRLDKSEGEALVRGVTSRKPLDATYQFKHALVQDAAYSSLVRTRRRQLHGRIARVLEEQFPSIAADEPATLANHFTQAGVLDRAITCWSNAGQMSLSRSAMVEATSQLKKALSLLAELPEEDGHAKQELDLQTRLGVALTATQGYAASETGKAYIRARQLCEELGDTTTLVRVGYGEFLYHVMRGEVRKSHQVATEILSLAEKSNNDDARILGHRTLGVSLFELGHLQAGRNELQVAAQSLEARERQTGSVRGKETRIMISAWLSKLLALQGYLDEAVNVSQIALSEANAPTSLHALAFAMGFAASASLDRRDYEDVGRRGEALYVFARDHNFPFLKGCGLLFRSYAQLHLGHVEGETLAREGLEIFRETEAKWALPYWLGAFAELLRQYHPEGSMTLLQEAFAAVNATEERWYEADLYRLRGEFARSDSRTAEEPAEKDFTTAKRIAEQQGSKLSEIRAATSLARLWRDQGRHSEARDLLAPVYNWFTEGLSLSDLKNARALLDELGRRG
jgi:predicted ATPase